MKPCINRTADSDDNSHPEQCPSTNYVKTPKCQSKCYNHRYHKSYTKDLHKGMLILFNKFHYLIRICCINIKKFITTNQEERYFVSIHNMLQELLQFLKLLLQYLY